MLIKRKQIWWSSRMFQSHAEKGAIEGRIKSPRNTVSDPGTTDPFSQSAAAKHSLWQRTLFGAEKRLVIGQSNLEPWAARFLNTSVDEAKIPLLGTIRDTDDGVPVRYLYCFILLFVDDKFLDTKVSHDPLCLIWTAWNLKRVGIEVIFWVGRLSDFFECATSRALRPVKGNKKEKFFEKISSRAFI